MDLSDKSILITGGTGSFGKKCIEILLKEYSPKKIIVFSRDELKQHEMRVAGFDHPSLRFFLGDVRDVNRLRRAFAGVDYVIHAAALKQVPACEYNPIEAVETNILGARNIIDAALDTEVKKVIALSTDKATEPVNLYGATKLVSEKLFVQANSYSGTSGARFSCVRYGNVLGSRGSVVPLFEKQRETGTVTVTDKEMTRFWITLDQGVRFVLSSLDGACGGEVFVPKIPSMRIMGLVEAVAPGCEVKVTGIRPGEKLHEALLSADESRYAIELDNMYIIRPVYPWWNDKSWPDGKTLAPGFSYRSDNNDDWLTVEKIRAMIAGLA